MTRSTIRLWPTTENCQDCIKTEAEGPHESVLLAVHQPMRFRSPEGHTGSEEDLLSAFLAPDAIKDRGTHLVTVGGENGSGKSHVVMWTHARLERLQDEKRHVIRIPKNTSLRSFVQRVLEGLDKDRFAEYWQKLDQAAAPLAPGVAAIQLGATLRIELNELYDLAVERIRAARQEGRQPNLEDKQIKAHSDPEKGLPVLLTDPAFRGPFERGDDALLARVATRAFEGMHEGEVEKPYRFCPENFELDTGLLKNAGRAGRAYAKQLERPKARTEAAHVLNQALDGALRQLVRADQYSLPDLFQEIRAELLRTDNELCVLIEDFSSLAGVHREVLNIAIQEGVRGGERQLCPLRTMIAVTPGTLADLGTVAQRAARWTVAEERASLEIVLDEAVRLTGAYLNAARIGVDGLRSAMEEARADPSSGNEWVPRIGIAGEVEALEGFDDPETGWNLFPFNREAIEQLVLERCAVSEVEPCLNPREVMSRVMRPVLERRDAFESSRFPSRSLLGNARGPKGDVEAYLRTHHAEEKDRYGVLARFWGNNPVTVAEFAHLHSTCFTAFGLTPLTVDTKVGAKRTKREPRRSIKGEPGKTSGRSVSSDADDRDLAQWEQQLEEWRGGVQLPQKPANQLRTWIANSVEGWIEWEFEGLLPTDSLKNKKANVGLPNAAGGRPPHVLVVCSEDEWEQPSRRLETQLDVRAVVRFGLRNHWDYVGGTLDAARYAAFIGGLAEDYVQRTRNRFLGVEFDSIEVLAKGLLVGGYILGLAPHDDPRCAAAVFAPADPPEDKVDGATRFESLQREAAARREDALDKLLRQVAARRGAGQPLAVNWGILDSAVAVARTKCETVLFDAPDFVLADKAVGPLLAHFRSLAARLKEAVQELASVLITDASRLRDWYDSTATGQETAKRLEEWFDMARVAGVPIGDQENRIGGLIGQLEHLAVNEIAGKLGAPAKTKDLLEAAQLCAEAPRGDARGALDLADLCDVSFAYSRKWMESEIEALTGTNTEPDEARRVVSGLVTSLREIERATS